MGEASPVARLRYAELSWVSKYSRRKLCIPCLNLVDDGTEVMECSHTPGQQQEPRKIDKYTAPPQPLPPPRPVSRIGGVIKVTGKIQRRYETRIMIVDEISLSSFGAQLEHWKVVRELHKTRYSFLEPFVIPLVKKAPETPKKSQSEVRGPQTPSTTVASQVTAQTPGALVSSPITVTSSPVKPKWEPQSPPKLRHPSRLRSQNLTDTAFRLYVKHFIDNAPEDSARDESDSDDEDLSDLYKPTRIYTSQILGTTTNSPADDADATPQSKARKRLKGSSPIFANDKTCQGFTLSYLRRVPELSLMAKRVVKQRARELDKKARDAAASQVTPKSSSSKQPVKRVKLDKASLTAKKKRLFQWAVCELLRDGSIVLWDGPKRPCPDEDTYGNTNASMLWKYSSSATADSSLFSNAGNPTQDDDDELELSDPEPDEEAYVSTKPRLLAPSIADALRALALAPPQRQVVKRKDLIGGSTKEDVLRYLRRDDRWAFIGEWNVAEALEYMQSAGMAWNPSGDRWLATG
ncbi:hypothetical protein D9756_006662 [Leucocoprinus leucothites]|uniref:CST complex subunit Stn1 N-terminal domain-containing protein n=1 Tax=Leucocoprinus leucothites TaxID=201217 RepID=A0A8H5G2P6_9AGAR|nr:hypothetical protein D9756_006662 [Leucoagaricus leucothites]